MAAKEKIQKYNNEAIIPPKLGDVWIPNMQTKLTDGI
jgi:hypothetical protein